MATLVELERAGDLCRYDPALAPGQQEVRVLLALPRLVKWFEDELPALGSSWQLEVTPQEQLDAFLADYAAGEPLIFQQAFHPIRHIGDGVWMLKTADVRLFGWFPQRDFFVGVAGKDAATVKSFSLYHGLAGEVVYCRSQLNLDEPKFLSGEDPDVVVSNYRNP